MNEEIKTISIDDKNYPEVLKKIPNAPKVLYIRGKINPKEIFFAVVGTRWCSDYGKRATLEITGDLCESGLTIVSGLAPGIDTISHKAVLEKEKKTIAVLGTGLDEKSIYPKENIRLANEIIEKGGALISEYPPGTRGTRFTFPQRNRIVSGLSLGVLVAEAKEKSGALNTALWAKKQEKPVFVVPGPIYSSNSKGCHYLIKKGAKLVESANDILKDLGILQKFKEKKYVLGDTNEENLILGALKEESLTVDKIIEKTNLPAAKVISIISILEIKNKIKNLGGNNYAISNS